MKPRRIFTSLLALVILTAAAFSQTGGYNANSSAGNYGLTAWAINNQRVASQFNYNIPSIFNSGEGGTYTFPAEACNEAIHAGVRAVQPFNANASVNIIDDVSANTETVAETAPTITSSTCTVNMSPANPHYSFHLRSGTCGVREALNDLNGNGGEVIIDQKFYDDGCTAATFTVAATLGGTLQANQYIHDISNGQDTWYSLQPSTLSALAVPTTSANSPAPRPPGWFASSRPPAGPGLTARRLSAPSMSTRRGDGAQLRSRTP